jgi:hypothetical protein
MSEELSISSYGSRKVANRLIWLTLIHKIQLTAFLARMILGLRTIPQRKLS